MAQITDRERVERGGCIVPKDFDHEPTGNLPLPAPPSGMDPRRFDADGWGHAEGLAVPDIHDAGGNGRNRFWLRCPCVACRFQLIEGRSAQSVERQWREHAKR